MPQRKLRIVPLFNTEDLGQGRIDLTGGFSIEDIKGLVSAPSFQTWRRRISDEELDEMLRWDLAIVHEFWSDLGLGPEEERSAITTRFLVAFCRFLHPTQTHDGWFIQGAPMGNEPFRVNQFSHRPGPVFLEDCEARSGLARPEAFQEAAQFVADFRRLTDSILDETFGFNPIVIAVRLSEQAYLDFDPQMRLLKRVMALEALFASEATYGKRALVPRVARFIGENTPIYPGSAVAYTVGSVIEDICILRNAFAHGNVVPDQLVGTPPESAVASVNVKSYADVLREASAVIVRTVLLRIFREKLLAAFSNKA
ncbi:MAG TPA: hypothetical protein VG860_05790, partial [Terriglobia bacterium]|nr:hypothetical protein [Terriglobia bacterium]